MKNILFAVFGVVVLSFLFVNCQDKNDCTEQYKWRPNSAAHTAATTSPAKMQGESTTEIIKLGDLQPGESAVDKNDLCRQLIPVLQQSSDDSCKRYGEKCFCFVDIKDEQWECVAFDNLRPGFKDEVYLECPAGIWRRVVTLPTLVIDKHAKAD